MRGSDKERPVRAARIGMMELVTAIVVVSIIAFAVGLIVSRGLEMKRLVEDGTDIDGIVVRQFSHHTRGSQSSSHFLRYRYRDAKGREHAHKSNVTRDFWAAHPEGSAIAITYSKSRPQVSAPRHLVEQARTALQSRKD